MPQNPFPEGFQMQKLFLDDEFQRVFGNGE
jgi:hypothetical protein